MQDKLTFPPNIVYYLPIAELSENLHIMLGGNLDE